MDIWGESLRELKELVNMLDPLRGKVYMALSMMAHTLSHGGKILVCGNGGSATDAQHFAAELVGKFSKKRPGLPAISLSSDPAVMTAVSNDYGYENLFARQLQALGKPGDLLLGISTSGRSKNVNRAVTLARKMGIKTVYLTGANPPIEEGKHVDVLISVPSTSTQRVQEIHRFVLHVFAQGLDSIKV